MPPMPTSKKGPRTMATAKPAPPNAANVNRRLIGEAVMSESGIFQNEIWRCCGIAASKEMVPCTCGRLDIKSNDLVLLRGIEHGVVSAGRRAVALKCVFFVDKERTKQRADGLCLYLNVLSVDNMTERCVVERKKGKKFSIAVQRIRLNAFGLAIRSIRSTMSITVLPSNKLAAADSRL